MTFTKFPEYNTRAYMLAYFAANLKPSETFRLHVTKAGKVIRKPIEMSFSKWNPDREQR